MSDRHAFSEASLVASQTATSGQDNVLRAAVRLRRAVTEVTAEEFRWQDAHYGQDSYYGRELLFLMANNEWTRATHETIDIARSDSVDTQIKVEVDLDQISHEAFRSRPRKLWLPLLILSGPMRTSTDAPSAGVPPDTDPVGPDPFATLTVTDAAGRLLAPLPNTDVWHRISAAMAEIVVNIAVARWSGRDAERPISTRDQRLLLSAAIYRMLRVESDGADQAASDAASTRTVERELGESVEHSKVLGRIGTAKNRLDNLLAYYIENYQDQDQQDPRASADLTSDAWPSVLTQRAVAVLEAFVGAIVVVVAVDSAVTPTVFTVRAPTRRLRESRRPIVGWPRAQLQIDLLLPSADADRQIQVNLPDGIGFDNSRAPTPRGGMKITVYRPEPIEQLCSLMTELLKSDEDEPRAEPLLRCIADLAMVKADAAAEALRHHLIGSTGNPGADLLETRNSRDRLTRLRSELDQLRADHDGGLARLKMLWNNGVWLPSTLRRPTAVDTLSPRAAVARVAAIEDAFHRAAPVTARMEVNVAVADAEFYSIARFAGFMSIMLMAVVLVFFAVDAVYHHGKHMASPNADVLAATLTLFSVIQAGRLRHPDTSTLRGLLSSTGNSLIVFSVMPTVILAIALAFNISGWAPVFWAAGAITIQISLVLLMFRGPLSDNGSPWRPPRRKLTTLPEPDYGQSDVLHTDWWRSTTAEALMIGTQAHAYVVWEHGRRPALYNLLVSANIAALTPSSTAAFPPVPPVPPESPDRLKVRQRAHLASRSPAASAGERIAGVGQPAANLLALLRSGTTNQAITFMIFREQPNPEWAETLEAQPVALDPDRLAPLEVCPDLIDILVGLAPDDKVPIVVDHPLIHVLGIASAAQLLVLDAQNPVPSPSALHSDWRWSRIRVGLRGADIYRVGEFLRAVCDLAAANAAWDVRVQMTPAREPRRLNPLRPSGPRLAARRLVLDSDLDAVTKASGIEHDHDSSQWRFMAICANSRVGIENDLLRRLASTEPELRLAGMNYAIMHGMAIVLLLGCQDVDSPVTDTAATLSCLSQSGTNVAIPVDQWQTCDQLGHAHQYPLLRVRLRNQDRPGIFRDLLKSLGTEIRRGFPLINDQINTWHAQSEILAGHAAFTRFSAPLPIENDKARSWQADEIEKFKRILEQIEREVRYSASYAAAAAREDPFLEERFNDEPVISIDFIEVPAETA